MKHEYELQTIEKWSYLHVPGVTGMDIVHGFFTASTPALPFRKEEKKDFLERFSLKDAIVMDQVHGDTVHTVRCGEKPDRGDGIIMIQKDVAAVIKTADCLPVILFDPLYPMAAIIHAGWRGTARGITRRAVSGMIRAGAARTNLKAIFGPSIGPCCYEVQRDVLDIFRQEGFPDSVVVRRKSAFFLDLKRANTLILEQEGIRTIYNTDFCTCCNGGLFHSYRRGDRGKRQLNFVSLRNQAKNTTLFADEGVER